MSQRQEKKVAEDIGGRLVAGSGAAPCSGGGDVRLRAEIRVECKTTEKNYFALALADLRKIRDQAIKGGLEQPVMQIRFAVPRSMVFEYAVTSGSGAGDSLGFVTDRKRVKLYLGDIQAALLQYPNVPIVFGEDAWNIRPWTSFLKELEQERAQDSHHP